MKDFKRALAGDRLSCTTYVANAFRLLLHAVAYRLLDALRRVVVRVVPSFGRRQLDTLRLLLLKDAALVGQSVRRVTLQLPAAFPMAEVFVAVARAIGATAPRAAGLAPLPRAPHLHPPQAPAQSARTRRAPGPHAS